MTTVGETQPLLSSPTKGGEPHRRIEVGGGGRGGSGDDMKDTMGVTLPRDAYLDNCKFALMILIGIGHALQWLLAVEDA
eukprot:CAMPEP_0181386640 /NCGR_PEP_ID=MMETSP1106-20121128/23254_1 /TAXON_ID=81844 /ORGANISM="Mantoniella antarctica, Strain SL-175" /LENGTH=78 /DNA_ID=CAMNT_0023506887 /DNA_START=205 /DNA_END=437 /DNA_ORIENTATION=+